MSLQVNGRKGLIMKRIMIEILKINLHYLAGIVIIVMDYQGEVGTQYEL